MMIPEAAERAGVTTRTIVRWIADGRLQTFKVAHDQHDWRHEITIGQLMDAETATVDSCLQRNRLNGRRFQTG